MMANNVSTLKAQTISGIKWQVGISLFQKAISLVTTVIVARHLGPSVYGLFGLAMIIVASFELFKSMGIDSALVRRKDDFAEAADTAFIIIPLLGFFLYFLLYLLAPTIGTMLKNTDISNIVRILGVVFVFTCFTKVPTVHLERNMKFMNISIAEFISQISFASVAIIAALNGYEIWSLVFAYIARVVTHMCLIWFFSGWRPRFRFNVNLALDMFHFGKFLLLGACCYFLKMNLDNFLVAKLLGTTMLGFYAVSFNMAYFGHDYFGRQITRVTFSAFSKLKDEKEKLRKGFLNTFKYVSILALPISCCLFIFGEDFIRVLYGDKWMGAVPILRVVIWAGLFNFLTVPIDNVLLSMGKSKLYFWAVFIQVALFFIFITPFAKLFGLTGVGIIVVIASVIAMIFELTFAFRMLSLRWMEIFNALKPAIIATLATMLILAAIDKNYIYFAVSNKIILFLTKLIFSFAVYLLFLFLMERETFKEIGRMIKPS